MPALRDRKEDIPLIAGHFIDKFCKKMGKKITKVPGDAFKRLAEYHWPGNVRELEHIIERAVILCDGPQISFSGFDDGADRRISGNDLDAIRLADVEREHIKKVLNATHWKVSGPHGAASILGLKPTTLLSRMKKLEIAKPSAPVFST